MCASPPKRSQNKVAVDTLLYQIQGLSGAKKGQDRKQAEMLQGVSGNEQQCQVREGSRPGEKAVKEFGPGGDSGDPRAAEGARTKRKRGWESRETKRLKNPKKWPVARRLQGRAGPARGEVRE